MMRKVIRTFHFFTAGLIFLISRPTSIAAVETESSCVLDIAAVVDITSEFHEEFKEFFQRLSYQVDVSEDGSHLGVITVRDSTETVLRFSDGLTISAVADALSSVLSGEGIIGDLSLNLSSAIQRAYDDILSQSDNRPAVPDVLLIVTDGHASIGGGSPGGVATVVVGVGDSVDITILNSLDSTGGAVHVNTALGLSAMTSTLAGKLCSAASISYRSLCMYDETLLFQFARTTEGEVICLRWFKRQCYCEVTFGRAEQIQNEDELCDCTLDACPRGEEGNPMYLRDFEIVGLDKCEGQDG